MCGRIRALGATASVTRRGADRLEVRAGRRQPPGLLQSLVVSNQLTFYDWEPNVIGNPYQPIDDFAMAIRLAARAKPRAEDADIPAGGPSQAVEQRLGGDQQKVRAYYDRENDTAGDRYYVFDATGRVIPAAGAATGQGTSGARNDAAAFLTSPRRPPRNGKLIRVPRGIVIVKAEPPQKATKNTPAQYFVLEDDSELTGSDIKNPKQNFDPQTQEPIVTMEFTDRGKKAFARVTKRIAERGQATLPQPGQKPEDRFQRFMISLDDQIVSLATIDYVRNPEGIDGETGAQINGIGNIQQTQDLADSLRIGALPVRLQPVK